MEKFSSGKKNVEKSAVQCSDDDDRKKRETVWRTDWSRHCRLGSDFESQVQRLKCAFNINVYACDE